MPAAGAVVLNQTMVKWENAVKHVRTYECTQTRPSRHVDRFVSQNCKVLFRINYNTVEQIFMLVFIYEDGCK
jgi:hypothetical protein